MRAVNSSCLLAPQKQTSVQFTTNQGETLKKGRYKTNKHDNRGGYDLYEEAPEGLVQQSTIIPSY